MNQVAELLGESGFRCRVPLDNPEVGLYFDVVMGSHAIPNTVALELSDGAAQLVEQLAHRGREVQALTERDEGHIPCARILEKPDRCCSERPSRSKRQIKIACSF